MTTPFLDKHMAVRMKDCIVVFNSSINIHEIWTYNLWTEQWNGPIPHGVERPSTRHMCGVAIGPVIYVFGGGFASSNLWKLSQSTDGSFLWNKIHTQNSQKPSPRENHSGWEYADKMWIFGGYGVPPVGYLNNHGQFEEHGCGTNNQLFSYDPSKESWTNMECFGDIPSPRDSASTAIIRDKVWLYGGFASLDLKFDLCELDLNSLTWTHIHTRMPSPQICGCESSLNWLQDNLLVLHDRSSTWILDVESYEWRPHHEIARCSCLSNYTCTPGVNSDVIILVGGHKGKECDAHVYSVSLEPKSLEQLAMRIIHQYKNDLPWTRLPLSLRRKLTGALWVKLWLLIHLCNTAHNKPFIISKKSSCTWNNLLLD